MTPTSAAALTRPTLPVQPVALAAGAIGVIGVAAQLSGPTLCAFRLCTGHACPGCGLTRSIGALFRGDVALSLQYHPVGILIAFQALIITIDQVLVRRAPESSVARARHDLGTASRRYRWLVAANGCLLVVVWAARWKLGLLDFVLAS